MVNYEWRWMLSMRGNPKFIYKKLYILTCLNFSHLKVLSIWCNTPIKTFFHCFEQFLNLLSLRPFSAFAIFFFVSLFPHGQNISLWRLFSSGETPKKRHLGVNRVNRKGGAQGSCHFLSKTDEHSHNVGRCSCKELIMKWANTLKESSKNSLKPNAASHNNTSWYTDTDRFLEHSPRRGSLYYKRPALQKKMLFWGGSPLTDLLWWSFCNMCTYQIIMLYTWN